MNGVSFLQDLAVVMIVAGLVTLLFHRLRQPVVLGYLLAGFIIGPHTPPFPLIKDALTIQTMADLGVVFLMFSLGLEFNLRKLRKVGFSALLVASFEILVMIVAGYLMGSAFGWSKGDCILLGVMLSLTSTMIVVKSLRDRGELHTRHAELISGISLFDDIFVILVMIALPGFAHTGTLPTKDMLILLSTLFIFLVAAVVIGLLGVPRLLRFISRHATEETLLIVSLGLCFGLSLFAVKLGFSAALGAFLIGAVVAESREVGRVTTLTIPLRDMFCAVFFVAIGMQINPHHLVEYLLPALLITIGYLVFKIAACSAGAFLAGEDSKTSIRVGTNMAQLGEFAFILAALSTQLGLTADFLYPLIVTIACLDTLVRPYFVDRADRIAEGVAGLLPAAWVNFLTFFRRRMAGLSGQRNRRSAMRFVWSLILQLALNLALIAGGFLMAAYTLREFPEWFGFLSGWQEHLSTLLWLATAILLLPLYIATVRKMQALAMMLAEVMTGGTRERKVQAVLRRAMSGTLFLIQLLILVLLTLMISPVLLPPWQTLIVLLLVLSGVVYLYGRSFNRWYSEAKFSLVATLNEPPPAPKSEPRTMPALLSEAVLEPIKIGPGTHEGRLIREIQLRTLTGASIVAVERDGRPLVNPGPDTELSVGDLLLLLGDKEQLAGAIKLLSSPPTAGENPAE